MPKDYCSICNSNKPICSFLGLGESQHCRSVSLASGLEKCHQLLSNWHLSLLFQARGIYILSISLVTQSAGIQSSNEQRVISPTECSTRSLAALQSKDFFLKGFRCTDPKIIVEMLSVLPVSHDRSWQARGHLPGWYLDDTYWWSVPTLQGYFPCREQTILRCAIALGLTCHTAKNKSCLWRKHIPYLKLWTGVIREFSAKPQKRNSLKIASSIQFFKLGSVSHFNPWSLSRGNFWMHISSV